MIKKIVFIGCIAALLFVPFLGSVHLFDWDEANFAELAREMIVSDNYLQPQINFLPFYEKPPLFIWLQVASMKMFGVNEFSARFPNAIAGIVVLISLFAIGRKHFGERMGWLWALSFGASIAPHFYFKTGLIDPIFNFFIFLSIYFFCFLFQKSQWKNQLNNTLLSALFAALAVMTKGPVAIILIIGSLGLGWLLINFRGWRNSGWTILWIIVTVCLSGIWFYYITKNYGFTYVDEFIKYQIRLFETEDAKHGGTILFHPVALLLGCFPASIFMWTAFKSFKFQISNFENKNTDFQLIFYRIMLACGIVVLVVFSIVQTKIIHYSSMDYYPMTFFSALGIGYMLDNKYKLSNIQMVLLSFIGFVWTLALTITPYVGLNIEKLKPFIKDTNFLEQLKTPIEWNLWACGLGLIFGVVFFYGIYLLFKVEIKRGIALIFLSCVLCIQIISHYYLPRIENMVQGSLVEFAKSKRDEDCYIQTLYFKSYLSYFYSEMKPHSMHQNWQIDTILNGKIYKDCYYVIRTVDSTKIRYFRPSFFEKNGFTYYYRPKI